MASSLSKFCFLSILYTFSVLVLFGKDVEGHDTILDLLEGNATGSPFDNDGTDFDIFTSLFTASSRGRRLDEDNLGGITVLAPDDNAFRRALGDLGLKTTSELETYENFIIYLMHAYRHPINFLTRILYYHIVPEQLNFTTALELSSFATLDEPSTITREGNTLIDGNSPDLPNPTLDTRRMNIQAANGVVHVIDYVLFPEVMRKIKLPEMENECSTSEPTAEEAEDDSGIGLVLDEDPVSGPTTTEEPSLQTDELSPTLGYFPVGPKLPSDTGSSISQEPGPQESTPPEIVSSLPTENFPRKEPSLTSASLEDTSDSSSPQASSAIDISAPPFPSLETPGIEIAFKEGPPVPSASVSPILPADETGADDFSALALSLGQTSPSVSTSPDASPRAVVNNESPTPFPFVGPVPEVTSTTGPTIPGPVPEVVGNKDPTPPPLFGPLPEAAPSSSPMTAESSQEVVADDEGPTAFPLLSPASETSKDTEAETTAAMEAEPSFPVGSDEILEPSEGTRGFSATPDADVPEVAATARPDASILPSP